MKKQTTAQTGDQPLDAIELRLRSDWPKKPDIKIEAYREDGALCIPDTEGRIYLTKEQAMGFFNLSAGPGISKAEEPIQQSTQLTLKALLAAAQSGKRDYGAEAAAERLIDLAEHSSAITEVAERATPDAAYAAIKARILSGDISSAQAIFKAGFAAGSAHAAVAFKVLDWILPSLQAMNEEVAYGCAAEVDAVQQVLAGQAPTLSGQPDENLKARCAEIAAWRAKGVLEGNVLRQYAKEKFGDGHDALSMAEGMTITEALNLLAEAPAERKVVQCNDPAIAVIDYVVKNPTEDVIAFLHCWNEGNFEALRREWPDAPEEIYIGADPLYQAGASHEDGPK